MVQTIAPKEGVLVQTPASEQSYGAQAAASAPGEEFLFEVNVDGAMPAGIPVEPAAVMFEATNSGYGDIFGEVQDRGNGFSFDTNPLEEQQANTPPAEPQQAALPSLKDAASRQPAVPPPAAEPLSQVAQAASMRGTVGLPLMTTSPSGRAEPPQGPVPRRAGSTNDGERLAELAQALGSTGSPSVGDDAGLSELAQAAGLRRNSGSLEAKPAPSRSGPLPAWNQAATEYPVLMSSREPGVWSRLRWPVVVVLLLGVIATAGYFLGAQKWLSGLRSGQTQAANGAGGKNAERGAAGPAAAPPVAQPSDASSKRPEGAPATAAPPEQKESPPAASMAPNEVDSAQAKYSLQAASFPNDAAAKEFSEKLIRAGLPAYVMSVEIPRRGRWFRVRVGRFATADEAAKYAAQCRQRARASGMNIDLIVCDYEKP